MIEQTGDAVPGRDENIAFEFSSWRRIVATCVWMPLTAVNWRQQPHVGSSRSRNFTPDAAIKWLFVPRLNYIRALPHPMRP